MNESLQYRARMEWNGIELFDRCQGRVIDLDDQSKDCLAYVCSYSQPDAKPPNDCLTAQLAALHLVKNSHWNVEPLTNTPFPKSSRYASAPRRIYWELTRACNLNCKACFNRHFSDAEDISTEQIIALAHELYDAGVYEIRCTGGEPTIRPDFFEIVQELDQIGFYISMGSNGIYSDGILQKVMNAPIDWIILSLDGATESTHAEIRGAGTFARVLKSLDHLADKQCRIRLNTLIRKSHHTYEHLKPLAALCDRYHIESLNCIPLRPFTSDPDALSLQLSPAEFRDFIQGLVRLRNEHDTDFITTLDLRQTSQQDRIYQKDRSCAAGREGAVISPYGEIYGCSYSPASAPETPLPVRRQYLAGVLNKGNFLDIWNDSTRWAIYRDLDTNKNKKCKTCDYYLAHRCIGNCPIMVHNNPSAFDPYCYLFLEKN